MACCPCTNPGSGASLNHSSSAELSSKGLEDDDEEPAICHESKAKILLKQGGPLVNEGTSSSTGLLVIGGVTYSNSSSSNSKGSAAEPILCTLGLVSEHLHRCSAIESTLASKMTLSAQTSSNS